VPASLAVATLIVCTFWGIASGLVGAVVVLMGVIAFNPMLQRGLRREARLPVVITAVRLRWAFSCRPSVMIIPSMPAVPPASTVVQALVRHRQCSRVIITVVSCNRVYIIGGAADRSEDRCQSPRTKIPVSRLGPSGFRTPYSAQHGSWACCALGRVRAAQSGRGIEIRQAVRR
jgi:hypothetical protein